MKAILVSEITQLEKWEPSYSALLKRVGGMEELYYSLDCIRASIDTFAVFGASLFYILVVDVDEVVAVLPFQRIRDSIRGMRRKINFWGHLDLYARNYHQRILADGYRPDAVQVAVDFINGELRKTWDVISLKWVELSDENFQDFVAAFPGIHDQLCVAHFFYYDASVDLDRHLGSSKRRQMWRRNRRLEEDHGRVEFEVKDHIDDADLEDIRRVHTARQLQKKNGGAFFSDPLDNGHIEKMIDLWNRRQCVRYYTLRVAGKLIALDLTYHWAGVTDSLLIAFDCAYAKYSPMRYLSYETYVHEIGSCGTVRIELGCDSEPDALKLDYSTDKVELHDIGIVNRRLRSRCVLALINGLFHFRRRCGAFNKRVVFLRKSNE